MCMTALAPGVAQPGSTATAQPDVLQAFYIYGWHSLIPPDSPE